MLIKGLLLSNKTLKEIWVSKIQPNPNQQLICSLISLRISKITRLKKDFWFYWRISAKIKHSCRKNSTWFTLITKKKCTFLTKPSKPTQKFSWISESCSNITRTFNCQKGSGQTKQPTISKNWPWTDFGSIFSTFRNSITGSLICLASMIKN
jgi:hypothetical protein